MTKEKFLIGRNTILTEIKYINENPAEEGKMSMEQKRKLIVLRESLDILKSNYIRDNFPCVVGDTFFVITKGDRRIKGVVNDLSIMDGEVFISEYYPFVNGERSSHLKFLTRPVTKIVKL